MPRNLPSPGQRYGDACQNIASISLRPKYEFARLEWIKIIDAFLADEACVLYTSMTRHVWATPVLLHISISIGAMGNDPRFPSRSPQQCVSKPILFAINDYFKRRDDKEAQKEVVAGR